MLDGQYNPFEQSGHLETHLLPSTYSRKTSVIFGNEIFYSDLGNINDESSIFNF